MIYLDNAATSFPKPSGVAAAMTEYMRCAGGNPGRGTHTAALRAAEKIFECRVLAANFFGAPEPDHVMFTMNTTYALNTALHSILSGGGHVLMGNMEHNSVFRPLAALEESGIIRCSMFDVRRTAEEILSELRRKVRPDTRVLICAHIPNTANRILPAAEIGAFCRQNGILFILDGAQSAGHLPIDMQKMNIDILCVPGHKGLFGPQGVGMMILGESCPVGRALISGGSGSRSLSAEMPDELPDHFEAGTLPGPAIAGLVEGIRWVQKIGTEQIHAHECMLWRKLYSCIREMHGIRVADPVPGAVLLFTADGISPNSVASELDRAGICVRAGYHCAPLGHRALGTEKEGAVRVSFSATNTETDVRDFTDALRRILKDKR